MRKTHRLLWALLLIVLFALIFLLAHAGWLWRVARLRSFSMPSISMEPTVLRGDYVLADFDSYRDSKPKRGDIVLIRKEGSYFVKRVVAVGTDTILSQNGVIFVNGNRLNESYAQHTGHPPWSLNWFGPLYVPSGKCFVMGDNRDFSRDSRTPDFGLIDEQLVAGKALYVISPSGLKYTPLR
jgi:signal peptidase I